MTRFISRGCSFMVAVAILAFTLPTSLVIAQTNTLSEAIMKTNMATSVESNGKLNLTIKAEGLTQQEQEDFAMVSEILNNLKVSFNSKISGNSNGTISKQYVQMSVNVGGSPYSAELWSDINLTGKTPVAHGIVKAPQLFEMMLSPEQMNKYMLLDFEQLKKMPEVQAELGSMDFGKMISGNKELQGAILTIFEKYSSQLSSGYNFISKEGNEFRVKIDDATFKDLIRKIVNLTAENSEIQALIRDLMVTEMKNSGASIQEINSTKAEIDQMFTLLESQGFLDEFNQTMDKLADVKILGDKGIDITSTIDENGYVAGTKGVIELALDMAKLGSIFGESVSATTEGIPTGIFTVDINFDVNYSNINGQVNVVLPTITSENSFNMVELFNSFNEPLPQELPESELQPVIVTHTVTGGQLPKTSTHLYEVLLMGTVLTLIGAFTWKRKKRYE